MISAVDTNIILDVVRPDPAFVEDSLALLKDSAKMGSMVMCDIVYAELSAQFASQERLDHLLADFGIQLSHCSAKVLHKAGQAWREYRRNGGKRERILSDFIIGSHAENEASRLLSRDRGFYRTYFIELQVLDKP